MQTISTFNFQDNDIRIISIDGIAWFIAKDVFKILDIKNCSDALSRLETTERSLFILNEGAGNPNINIINLSGFYNIVASCRKPVAVSLLKWITSLIIEDARKEDSIFDWKSISNTLTVQQEVKQTHTYIVYSKNKDMVKIGRSINPATRIRCLETQLGESLKIICVKATRPDLEQLLHSRFQSYRGMGEWFKLNQTQIQDAINCINNNCLPLNPFWNTASKLRSHNLV